MKVSTLGLVISWSVLLASTVSCTSPIEFRPPGVRQPSARADGFTTLHVDGDEVRIYRDEFGVPHIFATTNRGLFAGYGYAIAQDRLWQLEVFRHAAQGRLAELLGATTVPTNPQIGQATALAADTDIRTRHYTGTELQEQLALLDTEEREIFDAYAEGINRYLTTAVAADPASKLPFEFHSMGIGVPVRWTALDVVANVVYQSRFGQAGGQERQNQTLLTNLISKHGQEAGLAIFNDVRWIEDLDTPVSVPAEGALDKRPSAESRTFVLPDQLHGARQESEVSMEVKADAVLSAFAVPSRQAVMVGSSVLRRALTGLPCCSVVLKSISIRRSSFMRCISREETAST
jgi:acyl-homoserine lactone acylase PvdQ